MKSCLADVFGLSSRITTHWTEVTAAGAGMALPVLIGSAAGNIPGGLAASAGALMVRGTPPRGRDWSVRLRELAGLFVVVASASLIAATAAHRGVLADGITLLAAGTAAAVTQFSRAAATLTTRFIPFLIVATSAVDQANAPIEAAALMILGAAWVLLLSFVLGYVARAVPGADILPDHRTERNVTFAMRLDRWRRLMSNASGWQYVIRLVGGLATAGLLRALWPNHYLLWVAVTVALLTDRQVDWSPVRTTQRVIGTIIGLAGAALLMRAQPSDWMLVAFIALAAGLRPVVRATNYIVYTALITPLIMLIIDHGQLPSTGLLIDRVSATLAGAVVVFLTNRLVHKAIAR
jgi:Fusaric acid resistance protein-like